MCPAIRLLGWGSFDLTQFVEHRYLIVIYVISRFEHGELSPIRFNYNRHWKLTHHHTFAVPPQRQVARSPLGLNMFVINIISLEASRTVVETQYVQLCVGVRNPARG